jgi:hypothetical protein
MLERERFNQKIGASRNGVRIQEVRSEINNSSGSVRLVLVAYDSPRMVLSEFLAQEGKTRDNGFLMDMQRLG